MWMGCDSITFKKCERCGRLFKLDSPNQRYCRDYCKVQARKDRIRLRVQKHRKNGGNKEDKEMVRQRVENYREHWGFNNKNELLGSGRLSQKANPDFKVELKLIQWEKRRLGIK